MLKGVPDIDTNGNLGNRIRTYRTAAKMTQQEFAERLGITGASISAYENGTRCPSLDIIVKIAKLLNITTDELLTGKTVKVRLDVTGPTCRQRELIGELILEFEESNAMKAAIDGDKKLMDQYRRHRSS